VIVGVEGNINSGQVAVSQKVQKADSVTAVKGNIGR